MALTKIVDGRAVPMSASEEADFLASQSTAMPKRQIAKSVIIARLDAAGKLPAALAALQANPSQFGRWFAPDRPSIDADNPEALALLTAIEADPAEILA